MEQVTCTFLTSKKKNKIKKFYKESPNIRKMKTQDARAPQDVYYILGSKAV
jgi:hypothetical protein